MSGSSSGSARISSTVRVTSSLMRKMMISWTSSPVASSGQDGRSSGHLFGDPAERVLRERDVEFAEPAIGAHVVDHRPVRLVERRDLRDRPRRWRSPRRRLPRSLRERFRRGLRQPGRSAPDLRSRTPAQPPLRLHRMPRHPQLRDPPSGGAAVPADAVSVGGSVVADAAVEAPMASVAEAMPTTSSFWNGCVTALFMAADDGRGPSACQCICERLVSIGDGSSVGLAGDRHHGLGVQSGFVGGERWPELDDERHAGLQFVGRQLLTRPLGGDPGVGAAGHRHHR